MKKVMGNLRLLITAVVCMVVFFGCSSIITQAAEKMKPVKNLVVKEDEIVFNTQSAGSYNLIVTHVETDGSEKAVYMDTNNNYPAGGSYFTNGAKLACAFSELGTYNLYVFSEPKWTMKSYTTFEEYNNDSSFVKTKGKSVKITKKMPKPQDVEMTEVMQDNRRKFKITWKMDGYAHVFDGRTDHTFCGKALNYIYLEPTFFKKSVDVITKSDDLRKYACSDPVTVELPDEPIDPEYPFKEPEISGIHVRYETLLSGYSSAVLYWEGENGVKASNWFSKPTYHEGPYSKTRSDRIVWEMFKNTGKFTLYVLWSAEKYENGPVEELKQNNKIKIAETSLEVTDRMDQIENVKIQEETIDGHKWYRISWDADHHRHIVDYGSGISTDVKDNFILTDDYPDMDNIDIYTATEDITQYATSHPVIINPQKGLILYDPARQVGENAPHHLFPYTYGTDNNPDPPTDPSQPGNPTDPTQPSEPDNPTDPSQPGDPTDPAQPGDPGQGGGNTPGENTNPGQGGSSEQGSGSASGQSGNSDQAKAPTVGNNAVALPATIAVNGITYKIGADGKATVTKIGNVKKASINAVSYNGASYPVTTIAAAASKNNKKLTSVKIGSNVTKIGKKAFCGSKNLRKVSVNANKSLKIGKNAFKKISKNAVVSVKGVKGKVKKTLVAVIK
ncbi:leucine-rich repeat protein [Butyrivibrio sp. VCD2006]|uniref:leucine-rich repeat protein n=1 Tax=Butyrivibrio sp. VCD2006 TaxID=1280664 RepID=UPI0003FFAC43|nr:leucine-rich repeat protein [Butyrivibrio sp. VCD2006]